MLLVIIYIIILIDIRVRNLIAKRLLQRFIKILMITINNNLGEMYLLSNMTKILIKMMSGGGDSEIPKVPLIFDDIRVSTYKLIQNNIINGINGILRFQYINTYGNFKDNNTSILVLININGIHWVTVYYNSENVNPIINYNNLTNSLNIGKNILNKKFKEIYNINEFDYEK